MPKQVFELSNVAGSEIHKSGGIHKSVPDPRFVNLPQQEKGPFGPQIEKCGSVLLSHPLSRAVPSAQEGLTSVFGMGTGMAPPPSPPQFLSLYSVVL